MIDVAVFVLPTAQQTPDGSQTSPFFSRETFSRSAFRSEVIFRCTLLEVPFIQFGLEIKNKSVSFTIPKFKNVKSPTFIGNYSKILIDYRNTLQCDNISLYNVTDYIFYSIVYQNYNYTIIQQHWLVNLWHKINKKLTFFVLTTSWI